MKTAFFIGFAATLVWIPILRNLSNYFGNKILLLFVIIPIIFATGLYACRIFFCQIKFLYQFAKYAIIGFFSAGIDLAIFNIFIYLTEIERGPEIILFKAISFSLAMLNSYTWNKIWTFEFTEKTEENRHSGRFFQFAAITVFGLMLNVGATSLIISIPPPLGFTQILWNNIAAIAAIIVNVIFNFMGYKMIIFK